MQHILEPHQASSAERCQMEAVVLAVQDTTTLNYHGLEATEGLCCISGRGTVRGPAGAFRACGQPGGPAAGGVQPECRLPGDGEGEGRGHRPGHGRHPLAGRDAARPGTAGCLPAHPGDHRLRPRRRYLGDAAQGGRRGCRAAAARQDHAPAQGAARRRNHPDLWAHVEAQPPLARKTILLPACGGPRKRKQRKVKLDLRACEVVLLAPKQAADPTPTPMLAVSATEREPPKNKQPLHWLLLTNRGEPSAESAQQVVHWYQTRWAIETWFSVLKTGTRIKDRQLDDAEDLRKCLAFDAITACYVHDLSFMARTVPDTPASQVVGHDAIECLYNYRYLLRIDRSRAPPETAPDIRTFIIHLAGIAGFDSTKRQPLPGTRKLWEAYLMFKPILIYHRGTNSDK